MKFQKILSCGVALLMAGIVCAESYQEAWEKGYSEYKAKKYEAAATELEKSANLADKPVDKYRAMYYYGHALRHQKKYEAAAKAFADLLEVEGLTDKQKNRVFNQYLHNIYYQKKYQKVIDIAEKTLADDQSSKSFKTTCAYLGYLSNVRLKKYPEAEAMAKKLAELNAKGLWHNRGLIYQATALRLQKKYDEALATLPDDAIAQMHPHRQGEALIERGHILRANRKFPEAVIEYTKVYELENGHPNHKDRIVSEIILSFNSAKQYDEADVWIEKIDDINHKYYKSYALLRAAQLLEKQGKLEDAKAKYQALIANGNWWKAYAEKKIVAIDKKMAN